MGATVDKIRYGKWSGWIEPVGMMLSSLPLITAQPGFLSIDCGGETNQTGQHRITWVTDANYIDVGHTANIMDSMDDYSYGSYLDTLRFFPKPLNKSCYQLYVTPNVPYLLRLWFRFGNYSGSEQLPRFAFSIETLGMLAMVNVSISNRYKPLSNETILVSSGTVLYICLIRTSEHDDPFISAIELRKLRQGMYGQAKPGIMLMSKWRYDVGGNFTLRYPEDEFDRIWKYKSSLIVSDSISLRFVRSEEPISTSNSKELPPPAVMQTAGVSTETELDFSLEGTAGDKLLLLLYFAEIEKLNMYQRRSFSVTINGETRSEVITSLSNNSTLELPFICDQTDDLNFSLVSTSDATSGPIINAFEIYKLVDTQQATYAQDIKALEAIKDRFDLNDWMSDPCFLIQWNGVVCERSTSPVRISEIYLSGKNLTGLVPHDIGQLTALVQVSLNNNNFTGQLPNLSSLTMLERLYLQNNNLNGTLPFWLYELENLKELNIENNNFTGVIPPQLLNGSLKFSYCGNPYLSVHKKCIRHATKKSELKVLLGITLGGMLIITLALIAAIVVYRNKFGRKKQSVAHKRSGLEMEPRSFLYQDK